MGWSGSNAVKIEEKECLRKSKDTSFLPLNDNSSNNIKQKEVIDKDKFKKIKVINKNNFCNNYLIRSIDTMEEIIYKKINIINSNDESTKKLLQELEILKTLDHPNIISV